MQHIEAFNKYYKLSHKKTWQESLKDKWMVLSYNTRNKSIINLVNACEPQSVLDIGCGSGDLTMLMADGNREVVGIEPSMVNAQRFWCNTGLPVKNLHAESLHEIDDNSYDMVVMADVIEHVEYPLFALQEAYRVCKAGGAIILTTPNKLAEKFWSHFNTSRFRKIPVRDEPMTVDELKGLIETLKQWCRNGITFGHTLQEFYPRSRILSLLMPVCLFKGFWDWLGNILRKYNYRQVVLIQKDA